YNKKATSIHYYFGNAVLVVIFLSTILFDAYGKSARQMGSRAHFITFEFLSMLFEYPYRPMIANTV
uniref:hypothetical protein n=1 Tax=Enterocloster clostridioformis TaxID=1531 RepID=UPI0025A5117A